LKNVYFLSSSLLLYPDAELIEQIEELKREIEQIEDVQVQTSLSTFVEYIRTHNLDSLQENYVRTFDFGKKTNLYVTYEKYGEERERGKALLALKSLYEREGFYLDGYELPDYLPLVLEFLAECTDKSAEQLLLSVLPAIQIITNNLKEKNSYYAYVIEALLLTMEKHQAALETNKEEKII
jgi:nitrate reductase molybdenum cofactor assembly chaperone NarJ/NarW